MCGIWFLLRKSVGEFKGVHYESFNKIKNRGPDRSHLIELNENMLIGFHRLAIMDLSYSGDQPFVYESTNRIVYVVCNGEIYDHEKICTNHGLTMMSKSDCEVIGLLYIKFGLNYLLSEIKFSEFALVIVD